MSRVSDFDGRHAERTYRGAVNPRRAAPMLPRVSDGSFEVSNASELLFTGGSVTESEDGVAEITLGGAAAGGGTSSATAVVMLNAAGRDLFPGDVVVVDDTTDNAVTVTTDANDIRIAGVVQEPIANGASGAVLFNGYAAIVNAPDAVRGEYASTSTIAAQAQSTTSREAGSFAVYLTGIDFPNFVVDSATTTSDIPVTSLTFTLPLVVPVTRVLFLALWLEDAVSSVSVTGWTLIGAEAGFTYYYRVTTGTEPTTAAWTGASVAVAVVCLLDGSVSLAVPVEAHDYENTTAAASVSGLSAVPRYALAGVKADVASPGSDFVRIAGGTGEFNSFTGSPALVQASPDLEAGTTFSSPVTAGNVVLSIPFRVNHIDAWSTDPRQSPVACAEDTNLTDLARGAHTRLADQAAVSILGKISADTYAGPYGTTEGCDGAWTSLDMLEFENIGLSGYQSAVVNDHTTSTIDLGLTAGANDVTVIAIVNRNNGDPGVTASGFTEVLDGAGFAMWRWIGYRIGAGGTSLSFASQDSLGIAAVVLTQGDQLVSGTLAGKYIGDDASVTSPFSGAGNEDDAIFVLPLLTNSKPSALIYGSDLLGASDASGPSATSAWQPLFDSGSGVALIDSGTGNPILAFAPV